MRSTRAASTCALLLFVAATAAAQPFRLDGVWKQISVETDGNVVLTPDAPDLTISGDRWIVPGADPLKLLYYPKTNPKRIKLMTGSGRFLDTLFVGIYELENETLTVARPHNRRGPLPSRLATKPGDAFSVVTYKRIVRTVS